MIVRELITKLGFNLDEKAIKKAEAGFATLKTAALGIAATVTAFTGTMFALAKSAANAGDEALKAAQKTGLSVEEYQKLAYAAELADVSHEQLGVGLTILSKKMQDAATGGKAGIESFKAVGIAVKDAKGNLKSGSQVIQEVADRFQKMPDGAKKTALAVEVFGKSGAQLIPLLNGGGQSIRDLGDELEVFGGVIGEDAAKASEEFNDNFTRVHRLISSIKNAIGIALVPIIKDVISDFLEWAKANKELIRSKVKEWAERLGDALRTIGRWARDLGRKVEWLVDTFGGLGNVLKAMAWAFGIFTGGKILYAINSIIGGFRALGIAVGVFKTVALWEIYLVIAVIALIAYAVYLVYDDVKAWLEGRPNLFGSVYQWAVDTWQKVKEKWESFKTFFSNLWLVIKTDILPLMKDLGEILISPYVGMYEAVKTAVQWVGNLMKKLDEFLSKVAYVKDAWQFLKDAGEWQANLPKRAVGAWWDQQKDAWDKTVNWINNRGDQIRAGQATPLNQAIGTDKLASAMMNPQGAGATPSFPGMNIGQMMGGLNRPPGAGVVENTNNNTQHNQFSVSNKIDVNVTSTADPDAIASEAEKAVGGIMDKSLRAAAQALESGAVS